MPAVVVTSHLKRICRCTIFTAIFLMLMDSRLRPVFQPTGEEPALSLAADQNAAQQAAHPRLRRSIETLPQQPVFKTLLRKIRSEEEQGEEETTEENEESESDGPPPSEHGEEGEKPDGEEGAEEEAEGEAETEEPETETEPPTTRAPQRKVTTSTHRQTTIRHTTKTSKHNGHTSSTIKSNGNGREEEEEDDEKETANATHSAISVTTLEPEPICTPPAIRQFPPDVFSLRARRFGGLIIHLLVVVYMFLCLAVVCDDYFCGSLEQVCKRLHMSEDVAGATLMAAGSSAPELFASLIGVFVAKGDVGTGTIVGSAVFNILFVVGTCAFFGGLEGAQLSWWPVVRDTTFYAVSIVILILSLMDGEVTWYESFVMLIFYGLYVTCMRFNTQVFDFVAMKIGWTRTGAALDVEETMGLSGSDGRSTRPVFSGYEQFTDEQEDRYPSPQKPSSMTLPADERVKRNPRKLTFPNAALKIMMSRYFYPRTRFVAACRYVIAENQAYAHEKRRGRMNAGFSNGRSMDSDYASGNISSSHKYGFGPQKSFEVLHDEFEKWRVKPDPGAGRKAFIRWIVLYPIYFVLYYTIPDSKKEKYSKWYGVTFAVSIIWIAVFSYIMVWMVTVIGFTLSIPDSIMGITFLAAGTSIPDAMASLIVARQGMVDMAVSNSIGSNVFDILIGLALPWFIATAMYRPGIPVKINSNGLVFNAVLLFVTVGIAVGGLRHSGWKLTRRIGTLFYATYGVYLVLAVMIEYNVFGFVNPPMCSEEEAVLLEHLALKGRA